MVKIDGVVPVIPIPFGPDETIDVPALRKTVNFVAEKKMAAMCLPAYGSEFFKLSEAEREQVVGIALEVNAGRIPVITQANHGSSKIAAGLAKRYEAMGADVVSFAMPRQFGATDADLLHYAGRIADAVSCPILIQDFNPGGPTIGADFIHTLHAQHSNFLYAKLEEPMIIEKLVRIRERVGDKVGILEGWGGYYMLEAIPAGICGIMPGVPICELLDRVYRARQAQDNERAYDLFGSLLPFVNFTLQDFEIFLQVEKRLMVRRGLFTHAICRSLTYTPSPEIVAHMDFLIEHIVRVMEREGIST
ncbi:MAG: dihydrodipicolinate synthase family protein [Candidatus Latescibacterota bacterium]